MAGGHGDKCDCFIIVVLFIRVYFQILCLHIKAWKKKLWRGWNPEGLDIFAVYWRFSSISKINEDPNHLNAELDDIQMLFRMEAQL